MDKYENRRRNENLPQYIYYLMCNYYTLYYNVQIEDQVIGTATFRCRRLGDMTRNNYNKDLECHYYIRNEEQYFTKRHI